MTAVRRLWRSAVFAGTVLATALLWSGAHAGDKPSLKIFYTASVKGYIDQCGCRYNPTGGIERRATYLKRHIDSSIPTLILGAGDVLGAPDDIGKMQTRYLFRAMKEMGYHTLGVGPRDFLYGIDFVRAAQREYGFTFTSANVLDDATGRPVFAPYVIEKVSRKGFLGRSTGTLKVGIISVMGLDRRPLSPPSDPIFRLADPVASARRLVDDLRERTDLIVVLAYAAQPVLDSLSATDGVDVLISARPLRIPTEWVSRAGHSVIGYSSFQGRGVGWIDVTLDGPHHIARAEGDLAMMTRDIPDDEKMMDLKHQFEQWKANALTGGQ